MDGYGIWLGAGAALGLWQVARSAPRPQAVAWVNLATLLLAAALLGARALYVAINWGYFAGHPIEILLLRGGGLAWPGAVIGAAGLFLLVAQRFHAGGFPLGWLAERLYPLLPVLAITAWLGGWWAGTAYGQPAPESAWWAIPTIDENGLRGLRFPLQPLAALSLLLYFSLLDRLIGERPDAPGRTAAWGTGGLLAHLLVFSLLRGDPAATWHGLRLDAWLAGAFLALYLAALLAFSLLRRARPEPSTHNTPRFDSRA